MFSIIKHLAPARGQWGCQYLAAGLIDELHLAVSPILLGSGEHLLAGIDAPKLGYHCAEHIATPNATHVVLNVVRNRRADY